MVFVSLLRRLPTFTVFPYTTLFRSGGGWPGARPRDRGPARRRERRPRARLRDRRSEEHTSELQSPDHLVCRLLLEKKSHWHDHQRMKFTREAVHATLRSPVSPTWCV